MLWNPDRASQDWPGELRVEPPGSPEIQAVETQPRVGLRVATSDSESDAAIDLVDIVEVTVRLGCWMSLTTERCVFFDVAAEPRVLPGPRVEWVAWGIVVDYTGDGLPDMRLGIDNAPGTEHAGIRNLRMWRTDLVTVVT